MAVTVAYLDEEPNGLAAMLGGVIDGNLAAHPEREALLANRATYSIVAQDVDVAVSIRLGDGAVKVRNGVVGRPDVLVQGDSNTLISLSTVPLRLGLPDATRPEGREVMRKLVRRELRVKGLVRHPAKLARLNKLLAV
jgi:hypothetical protein